MRVDEVVFTPLQAIYYFEDMSLLEEFLEDHGLPYSREIKDRLFAAWREATEDDWDTLRWLLHGRDWGDSPTRRPDDRDALVRFAEAHQLPIRIRQVYELCIRDQLTHAACAERLRIGRETVRTYLRRLREMARRADDLAVAAGQDPSF
jgi:DNA-binding CsgD family transcriptional regulator